MTAESDVWQLYGFNVAASWPLSRRAVVAEPDLTLRLGEPQAAPADRLPGLLIGEARGSDGGLHEAVYDLDGEVSLLVPGFLTATFDARRTSCVIHADPTARSAAVQRYAATAVLATWMILGDVPVLHASAAQVGDSAVLFVGNSGSGKSTMTAALVGAGATAISDDVCRLAEQDGHWVCHPDMGHLRLRAGSEALATLFPNESVASAEDRLTVTLPTPDTPVPVGAIIAPRISRAARGIEATRLRGTRSLVTLLEHPRMASLGGDEFSAALFRFASALVTSVGMWELLVPWGPVTPELGPTLMREVTAMLGSP